MPRKKRKPTAAELKSGVSRHKFAGREYEAVSTTKMGSDGVPEDHLTFVGQNLKRQIFVGRELKCRNVMTNADRRRLGLPEDK